MTTPDDSISSHGSIDRLLAEYLIAVESGEVPSRQQLLDQHPEHAGALRAFFADLDRMDRMASPLRLRDELAGTDALDGSHEGVPATIRYFGDYELLEEIARGGMGVVYKARQATLNRVVALKMILHGTFASEHDVARFRTEAESAANLDHPHVVPIHEVGHHEGYQYYTMKFIEGTSLARHPRSTPRQEVEALVPAIRAVHHAHQRGVLHRDLKLSNLLVDGHGVYYVTDFGLAKRFADVDRSITETGQVLGTPGSMSPEQASGRKDLTVASDVYSLGVILYDRLTGRPPFLGEDLLGLLRQVREQDPPRPTSILPTLERDLETIILKCLEKEPPRRYSSAEALASDLDHWLRGEPIEARPVSRAERVSLWCRRNPVVSGMTLAVAASLVLGIIGSTYFAVQSSRRAAAEARERARATRAEKEMEGMLARGLARPLNPAGTARPTLSTPEVDSLWDLARLGNTDVGLRLLSEATRDPKISAGLSARSEPALIATVGLDVEKGTQATRLLSNRLHEPGISRRVKFDLALLRLELANLTGNTSEAERDNLLEGIWDDSHDDEEARRSRYLALSTRIDSGIAAWGLVGALERTSDADAVGSVVMALCDVVGHLDPPEAARLASHAASILVDRLGREVRSSTRAVLTSALTSVAGRMEPPEAARISARAADILARAIGQATTADSRSTLTLALADVAVRLDPAEADRICSLVATTLVRAISRATDSDNLASMATALSRIAGRMGPNESARLCSPAADTLALAIDRETYAGPRAALATALCEVAGRLGPTEAARISARAANTLAGAIERETSAGARSTLATALSEVALRMEPSEAAYISAMAANTLALALGGESKAEDRSTLATALDEVARRMNVDDAARLCVRPARTIAAELGREPVTRTRSILASALTSIAARLDPADAAGILAGALGRETDSEARSRLAVAMTQVSARSGTSDTGRLYVPAATALAQAIGHRETDAFACPDLASALSAMMGRLEPVEASRISAQVATRLGERLDRETNSYARVALASALNLVVGRIHSKEAVRISSHAAATLSRAIGLATHSDARLAMARALTKLVQWMDPPAAAYVSSQTATALSESLGRETDVDSRSRLASALSSMAFSMNPAESARLCGGVIRTSLGRMGDKGASESPWNDPVVLRLLRYLDPSRARALNLEVVMGLHSERDAHRLDWSNPLEVTGATAVALRAGIVSSMVLRGVSAPFAWAGVPTQYPSPCRLTTEELVELLKMPTCFGESRRIVLDHLGSRFGRRFVNHWAFVRFAREQNLLLDFTTPPRRPDPGESRMRMLEILDNGERRP